MGRNASQGMLSRGGGHRLLLWIGSGRAAPKGGGSGSEPSLDGGYEQGHSLCFEHINRVGIKNRKRGHDGHLALTSCCDAP